MSSSDSTTVQSVIAAVRPWSQFFDLPSFYLPVSISEATARVKRNLLYFRVNYTIIALLILFLSLIFQPISLIVFLVFVAWFLLYFFRDVPHTIFNYTIDDRAVLGGLGVVTVVALVLTSVWVNVLVMTATAGVVACVHGGLRGTEDLVGDDMASPYSAMLPVVDDDDDDDYDDAGAYGQI